MKREDVMDIIFLAFMFLVGVVPSIVFLVLPNPNAMILFTLRITNTPIMLMTFGIIVLDYYYVDKQKRKKERKKEITLRMEKEAQRKRDRLIYLEKYVLFLTKELEKKENVEQNTNGN